MNFRSDQKHRRDTTLAAACLICLLGQSEQASAEPVNPFAKPPMVVAVEAAPGSSSGNSQLALRGVLLAGSDSLANISGTLYGIDETVAGMRVADIGEDYVALTGKDSQLRLTLADSRTTKRIR